MSIIARRNLMAEKSGPTAKDYVQDGLIAMWDGIENAGWGVHDPNATVWKDLSGNGHDFVFSSVYSVENTVSVYPNSAVATMPNGIVTVELSLSSASGQRLLDVGGRLIANRCSSSKAGMQFDNGYGCYLDGDGLNSTFACDYSSIQTYENKLWLNGYRVPTAPYWTPWPPYEPGTLSQNWSDTGYVFTGSVRFLRFYNRSLSDAEIAANYAIDKARFNLP